MSVISVTITESTDQIVSGIPRYVTIALNIPATIFYTLDGADPTISSNVYVDKLYLPTYPTSFILKVLATNGVDSSIVISNTYGSNTATDIRTSHSAVLNSVSPQSNPGISNFPFGSTSASAPDNGIYLGVNKAGNTVDNPLLPNVTNQYDGASGLTSGTDEPLSNYPLKYDTTNNIGEPLSGIGSLPPHVTVITRTAPPETSNASSLTFNPKALVIFQDFSTQDPTDAPFINRMYFSLENAETVRDGALLFNAGLDSPTTTGSFLRAYYNPTDRTQTFYYYDNSVGRWLISKQPYEPGPNSGVLYNVNISRKSQTNGFVFKWIPFMYRTLV